MLSFIRSFIHIFLASAALLSTKYILVDRGCYHPLHLLLLQLVSIFLFTLRSNAPSALPTASSNSYLFPFPITVVDTGRPAEAQPRISWILLVLLAVSLPLFAQAIVHFSNLPTLSMLMSLTLLAEHIVAQILTSKTRRLERTCGLLVVSIAFSVLLFDEYRLTVNGLLFGLFALGFTAIGKLPILIQFRTNQSNSNVQAYLSWNTILRIVVSLSIVITASWAIFVENTFSAIESLVRVNPWKVVLNLGLVFCTCVFGSSSAVLSYQESLFSFDAAPELFLFAGLTSLSDLMSARRSYSAYSQVLVFAFAFVMSFIRGWGSNAQFNQEEEDNIEKWAASGQDEHTFRFSSDSDPEAHSTDDLLVHLEVTRPSRGVCETSMHAYRTSRFRTIVRGYKIVSSWSGLSRASYMMIAFGIWCSFSYLNFSLDTRTAQNNHTPSLDLSYHSKFDLDIVMSMYDEDPVSVAAMISELRRLPNIANKTTRVLIYFKGKGQDVYIEALKHRTGATEMIHLPNIGREGESYLYHIISKYDDLAKHTLFLQAHVHNSWELKRRIGHYFVPNTGMLNLGFSEACDCNDCWDRFGWHDNVVSGLHQSVYNSTCSDILLSYKGQFIVSAQRIRGSDPKIYSALQEALVDPDSWAHKEPYLRGRPDSMSAPRFGYTLERLWSILFQCSEMDIVEKCPTLLSGTRSGGELSDCQCLDGTAPMEPLSA